MSKQHKHEYNKKANNAKCIHCDVKMNNEPEDIVEIISPIVDETIHTSDTITDLEQPTIE